MEGSMRFVKAFLIPAILSAALAQTHADLAQVQTVYVLPMGSGMDQFLANRLIKAGVFRVVADPQLADAVLTEHLGERFEERLKELYPNEDQEKAAAKPSEDAKDEETRAEQLERERIKELKEMFRPKSSSWNRGKGTYFLVDRRSKHVIWSVYQRPKDMRASELDKAAERIVKQLKRDKEENRKGR